MKHDLGLLFWIHLIIVLLAWASPFYLSWKIILALVIVFYLQLFVIRDCILNTEKRETTICIPILKNLGFKVNKKKLVILSDYIFPWLIILVAILWQIVLKK